MSSLRHAAIKDYNDGIVAIKTAAKDNDIDTVASVTSCGIRGGVRDEVVNSSITRLQPISHYEVDGSTPLFDSVGRLIEIFKSVPDYDNSDVTFLVMAVTDGEENASHIWKTRQDPDMLDKEIRKLQGTDRWTFVFRVPKGYARNLERLGIPSERFDIGKVLPNQVVAAMLDISNEVVIYPVPKRSEISSFLTLKTRQPYRKGTGFYQLSKPEKAVQDYKVIVARNKNIGAVYGGTTQIRQLLGLPLGGTISLRPGDHGDWDLFIQSTSTNRVLMPGTSALYWEKA